MSVHASSPLRLIRTGPPNVLGFGTDSVASRAVDLDVEVARRLHVEARHERGDRARRELDQRSDVGRHLHVDELRRAAAPRGSAAARARSAPTRSRARAGPSSCTSVVR